jgi:hypothetical protein
VKKTALSSCSAAQGHFPSENGNSDENSAWVVEETDEIEEGDDNNTVRDATLHAKVQLVLMNRQLWIGRV